MSSSEDNAPSLQVMEGSLVLETESSRSVRKRVPTARYLEEDSFELVKKICAEMSPTGKKRGRKSAAEKIHSFQCKESTSVNKWNAYKRKITQLARSVARDQHFIDSYEFDESDVTAKRSKHTPENELRKCNARIISSKKAIVEQFALLDAENAGHKHWLQLRTGFDEEDTVDVDDIMCSVCGEPDEENNDVLFCDRANCLRAYHQMCLDPPVLSLDEVSEDADWFCRQCACMDECLDMVGEVLGHDCDDFRELFPELRAKSGEGDASWMLVEDSESEDADYDPSELDSDQPHQVSEDEEEGSDTGKIPPPTGVEDVSDRNGEEDDSDSGDSDDSGDSGSDASDESSGVDQDELQGLLMDAEADGLLLDLPTTAQDGEPSSNSASAPRRNLRPRRAVTSPGANDKSRSPEGPADIGKAVAIVRRGVLIRGEIKAFRYRSANRNSPARVKKGKHRVTASTSPPPPSSASSSAPSQPTEFGACANSISAPIAVSPVAAAASVSASAGSRLGKEGGHGDGVAGLLSSGADYFCDSPPPPMGVASTYTAGQLLPAVENGNILEHCDGNTETYGRGSASAPAIDATQAGPPSLEDGMWTAKFDDDHIAILDLEALK